MSIKLSSNFDLVTGLPLDARYIATDTTDRDAIDSIQRFEGLQVYVLADQVIYHLKGGVTNSDWAPIGTGAAGKSVLNGSGAPDDTLTGSNGDFYIDTDTWNIYGPKTAGVWGSPTSLIGPQGDPGGTDVSVLWEGTSIVAEITAIDFRGPGVQSVVDSGSGVATVTIEGGGGTAPKLKIFGACDTPLEISATGIKVSDDHMSQDAMDQLIFVEGDSGPVDITSNPQIGVHNFIGAMLTIIGRSDTNTVTLQNGDGLVLNGTAVLGLANVIRFIWNGSLWVERRRNF